MYFSQGLTRVRVKPHAFLQLGYKGLMGFYLLMILGKQKHETKELGIDLWVFGSDLC